MKITKEIIQKIEGEATLELEWKEGKIAFAKIKFLNFRGIENILKKRPFLDAIAITPRVCGICSTSHTLASISAIEDGYKNAGYAIEIPRKAQHIREIVLNAEKIQNHIKWFYFNIYPELIAIDSGKNVYAFEDFTWQNAQKIITKTMQMAAIFCGQWPHASFCIIGGVTTDPLKEDLQEASMRLEEIITFCEQEIFGVSLEEFLENDTNMQIMASSAMLKRAIELLHKNNFDSLGKSYDRFIAFGESFLYASPSKCTGTIVANADVKFVREDLRHTFFQPDGYTYSKSAVYKEKFYETGPLARLMVAKNPLIKDFHRRYKDATLTRIVARVSEIAHLLQRVRELLQKIDIKESSCNFPKIKYQSITTQGTGVIEAARGSLIHTIDIQNGLISKYDIITPTVWNLGNGTPKEPSVAQNAIIGMDSVTNADFIFKSFDVCSVCTTQ
ncbi:MAG: nickel-dependent hydrogenase large subunit [Sulfurospirillum sp.]|nr:nickel-dependent hydrogenase large subunit [Sulfurospirillum sp.]